MSVHNEYTGYTLKHLLLRHMYNLPLLILMCYVLKPYALRLPADGCSPIKCWRSNPPNVCVCPVLTALHHTVRCLIFCLCRH